MLASNLPGKFTVPFANGAGGGYIRAIPTASQIGVVNGAASLTDGFPPLCFTPVGSGGVPPFGQDFNGILNQITAWNRWMSAGGPVYYDSAFSTAIGGYPQGAVLTATSLLGSEWYSLVDNNTTNPDASGAGWALMPGTLAGIQSNLRGLFRYGLDTGAANTLVCTVSPAITARTAGDLYIIKTPTTNTSTVVTFNPSGLGAASVRRNGGTALAVGDIVAGGYLVLEDDGTNFNCVTQLKSDTSSNISNYFVTNYAPGALIARRTFTSSGTYTPTTGTNKIRVTLLGGGGAGGGAATPSGSNFGAAGGGGAGGITVSDITSGFSSQTITIGAAGAASLGGSGGAGGTSTFMALTATGGTGGAVCPNTVATPSLQAGGAGGAGSGGTVYNGRGGGGGTGAAQYSNNSVSGVGGYSFIGAGGSSKFSADVDGDPATSYGAGGGGACGVVSGSQRSGGVGGAGVCIIEEYA